MIHNIETNVTWGLGVGVAEGMLMTKSKDLQSSTPITISINVINYISISIYNMQEEHKCCDI